LSSLKSWVCDNFKFLSRDGVPYLSNELWYCSCRLVGIDAHKGGGGGGLGPKICHIKMQLNMIKGTL
jgi:hypothetical protein